MSEQSVSCKTEHLVRELREVASDHAHGEGYLHGLLRRAAANIDALQSRLDADEQKYRDELGKRLVGEVKFEQQLAERDEVLRKSIDYVDGMINAAGNQPSIATGYLRDIRDALLSSAEPVKEEPRKWPKERDVGRYGDMSQSAHIRVGLDGDSDAYVSVYDEEGGASVEFCTQYSGGGKSPKTREALIALMLAIEEDNAAHPDFDWWKRRAPAEPAKGGDGEAQS